MCRSRQQCAEKRLPVVIRSFRELGLCTGTFTIQWSIYLRQHTSIIFHQKNSHVNLTADFFRWKLTTTPNTILKNLHNMIKHISRVDASALRHFGQFQLYERTKARTIKTLFDKLRLQAISSFSSNITAWPHKCSRELVSL